MSLSLIRALRDSGKEIHVPWDSLAEHVTIRPGNLIVAQAAPGVGKSLFGLAWAMALENPSLIVSLDTDPRTQAIRLVSSMTGKKEKEVLEDLEGAVDFLESNGELPLRWVWDANLDDIEEIIEAETVLWGEKPELVVVDNVMDLVMEESAAAFSGAFTRLKSMARRHDVAILALHHLNRGRNPKKDITSGTVPISLSDALYAGDRQAALVLGLWRPMRDMMRVGILKNRSGKDSKSGRMYIELACDLEKASLKEVEFIEKVRYEYDEEEDYQEGVQEKPW